MRKIPRAILTYGLLVIVEPEQDQHGDLEGYVHEKEELVLLLVEASERSEVGEVIGDESKEA